MVFTEKEIQDDTLIQIQVWSFLEKNLLLIIFVELSSAFLPQNQKIHVKARFTHANFVGRFLKFPKQTQAKPRFNEMTSPILFWPDFCLDFAWDFESANKIGVCKSGLRQ